MKGSIVEFRINTDTWFIFSILFVGALAFFIALYLVIPYFTRKNYRKRAALKNSKKQANYEQLEQKYSEQKINNLKEDNHKLQVNLKNDLLQLLKSKVSSPDLLPFFSTFEKVYPHYSQSLQKIIPTISANELKLCALLRLNLSSKEVSLLLNITPESVNKARYRLRKKMGLNSNEDLFMFLSNT